MIRGEWSLRAKQVVLVQGSKSDNLLEMRPSFDLVGTGAVYIYRDVFRKREQSVLIEVVGGVVVADKDGINVLVNILDTTRLPRCLRCCCLDLRHRC